ncbi:MAG: penicillin-binding transpeptidase domain-containing protein, partial [Micrococcales bacterium]|nr:penicillin-binding transpeptidase domain-containing protein [Micrococcales bacterium]
AANLSIITTARPSKMAEPISARTAAQLTQMMELVVTDGSARTAQIPGVRVAAKTGTAEDGNRSPHVWFTGFAPADNPQVAVVVFVKNGGEAGDAATGGRVAAPMAKLVIEAVLNL